MYTTDLAIVIFHAAVLTSCAATLPGERPATNALVKEERMTLENHKSLATAAIVDVFNERKYERVDVLVAADFRSHNPQVPPGPDGLRAFARKFSDAFSDFRGEIRDTIAEGDKVMIWVHWRGTHTGTFAGVRASGNTVAFDTIEIFRVANGKLAEHWDVADRTTLMSGLRGAE